MISENSVFLHGIQLTDVCKTAMWSFSDIFICLYTVDTNSRSLGSQKGCSTLSL